MSDVWLKSNHAQIGVAFTRAVGQTQEFAKRLDRSDPADSLVLAGFGTLLNLIAMQLEYTLDRAKRDPEAMFEAFAEEIAGYKLQIQQEATMPVLEPQLETKLSELGVETETTLQIPFSAFLYLRYLGYPVRHDGRKTTTAPAGIEGDLGRELDAWEPAPGEVRRMGRELCGLPL